MDESALMGKTTEESLSWNYSAHWKPQGALDSMLAHRVMTRVESGFTPWKPREWLSSADGTPCPGSPPPKVPTHSKRQNTWSLSPIKTQLFSKETELTLDGNVSFKSVRAGTPILRRDGGETATVFTSRTLKVHTEKVMPEVRRDKPQREIKEPME